MVVERTQSEIIIRIPNTFESDDLQDFLDYISYKELSTDVNIPQAEIDKLASDLNKNFWKENRGNFIK